MAIVRTCVQCLFFDLCEEHHPCGDFYPCTEEEELTVLEDETLRQYDDWMDDWYEYASEYGSE